MNPTAKINMEDGGEILIELYPEKAPVSVSNFTELANRGFYDGLIFHRVINGFMIQGGCPDKSGTGGPGYGIKGEFKNNGFENDLPHKKGALSMARSQDMDSAGSQFFIVHEDAPHLDGNYAAFGMVYSGQEVVDRIAEVCTDKNDRPTEEVIIKEIRVEEHVDG